MLPMVVSAAVSAGMTDCLMQHFELWRACDAVGSLTALVIASATIEHSRFALLLHRSEVLLGPLVYGRVELSL